MQKIRASSSTSSSSMNNFESSSSGANQIVFPADVRSILDSLYSDITKALNQAEEDSGHVIRLSQQPFEARGKLVRPTVSLLMAGASNLASKNQGAINDQQRKVAIVSEMIHVASLVHDDVIDSSDQRRNRPTVNASSGNKTAILIGDYILAKATQLLASTRSSETVIILSQILADLVRGEFMQLGSRCSEDERFLHYMTKTFKKTASLFAHSCKAMAFLAGGDRKSVDLAFEFGKNFGLAFQLIDDTLDFVHDENRALGKPTFVDLKLGLATAPVLFACRQHPELGELILRRFCRSGDVDRAYELILRSDGLMRSRQLASQYCREAGENLKHLPASEYKTALQNLTEQQSTRQR